MANVLDLAMRHVDVRRTGKRYSGPSPCCGGSKNSTKFAIYPDDNNGTGSWHCFSCGKGGDNIQFLIEYEGMPYHEACKQLGIDPKKGNRGEGPAAQVERNGGKRMWTPDPSSNPPPEAWREKAKAFVTWAFENLMVMDPAEGIKGWLAARGVDEFVIKHFGIGWNPGKDGKDLFRPRESWGLPTEMKGARKKKLWLPAGVVIPLLDSDMNVMRIRIRREADEPRYYVIPGSSMDCLVAARSGVRSYAVVESELDAMMMFYRLERNDIPTGVVALGNSSRKPDANATRKLRDVPVILNALDYDKAGINQVEWWTKHFPGTIHWPVPLGKDPGEAFEQGVDIAAWIKAGLPKGWFL